MPEHPKYTLCPQNKTRHSTFGHNFGKYIPIFKIISLLDFQGSVYMQRFPSHLNCVATPDCEI